MSDKEPEKKTKDNWDRFGSIGPFLSGLVVAAVGLYFTHNYNNQQLRLSEIQTVERFIPRLLGPQEEKEIAIIAISAMGNTELATKLAARYPSPGTQAALQTLVNTGDAEDKSQAQVALATVQKALGDKDQLRSKLVKEMFDSDRNTRIAATTRLIREYKTDDNIVPETLDIANNNKGNPSGIINTLVLFESIDAQTLRRFGKDVSDFLDAVSKLRDPESQTASHVNKVKLLLGSAEATK